MADLFNSPEMDDLFCALVNVFFEAFSASVCCSLSLVPNCLDVSTTYVLSQLRHGISYSHSAVCVMSRLSLGWTRMFLSVWCGLKDVLIQCLLKILLTRRDSPSL